MINSEPQLITLAQKDLKQKSPEGDDRYEYIEQSSYYYEEEAPLNEERQEEPANIFSEPTPPKIISPTMLQLPSQFNPCQLPKKSNKSEKSEAEKDDAKVVDGNEDDEYEYVDSYYDAEV